MVYTSEALSVGLFRISVRKLTTNEMKDVVCSVTVVLWCDLSGWLLYLLKCLQVLSSSNYLQLCDEDILKGVDFWDLFLAYVGDYSQVTVEFLHLIYSYVMFIDSGGSIMQNGLYPCFQDWCVLVHR